MYVLVLRLHHTKHSGAVKTGAAKQSRNNSNKD